MVSLTRVDKLEYLVLVDNSIERLSKLPPGFSHELPAHLAHAHKDELTGLPVTAFEDFCCGAHGLSILITTTIQGRTHQVLFDAGPEGLSIDRNVQSMRTDLTALDALVLSHWHRDHSGGILRALEMRNEQAAAAGKAIHPVSVDLHPDRPIRRGLAPGPKYIPVTNWLPDPTFEEMAERNGRADLHADAHEITVNGPSGVFVSGEIPRVHPWEKGLKGAVTWMVDNDGTGEWCTDEKLADERYVAVDVKGKGLVLFSACSHAGICNVVTDAVRRFDRPVYQVVGGLHLIPVETQPVAETVEFLATKVHPRPQWIVPLHCTGFAPRAALAEAFGDRCVPSGVGIKVVVQGDDAADAKLDDEGMQGI
ncbi:hypothetical protein CcaverHIS002_0503970 [Cutaneotrichosporon cavernicola]|uniref:Metallo-beta-lactamase domain-containing protein n=1 Tax=Cutaneotrichosporon cavernicola TaxID=279322 RepID=A0AA48L6D3_9TREE|nr:uncharacterized protein CcaverHIS019_0504520 [Cutaneotrichosporon cavernicola]BEI84996.1 hypothetical protein CcaverHIS002_0503970 [Cutaneotrichosporon cavernicola]BEI92824.1 hypothetical protein CcaverHIS019_0504520 [Cutaneotrichosporon cavernicola]BEJ00600.1 hypothetical protein CcaverHIS631_0504570 [Cutaneotrichosporon cavernicola]